MKVLPLALLLTLAVVSTASAEVVGNGRVPIAGIVTNPCNGENVALAGDIHLVARITLDGNGGFHGGLHINAQAQGDGASGAKYNGNTILNANLNANSGGAAEGTFILNVKLNGQGKTPNFNLKIHLHATVNANGDVTSEIVKIDASCK